MNTSKIFGLLLALLAVAGHTACAGVSSPRQPTPTSPNGQQAPTALLVSDDLCFPLDPPAEPTVTVSTVAELQSAVNNATSGTTILLADGIYNLDGVYLRFDVPNVTLRSVNGNRENVTLDGNYVTTEIVQIVASNVTIADLTLREAYYHPIHVMSTSGSDTLDTLIYNVHIVDPGEQAIKINPYTGENALYFPDDGVIACSHIELTDVGRPYIRNNCYTGGVDAHQAQGWIIRDNLIEGFWCDSGLSEHGIHLWRSCRDTLVERNELRDNARGIGFGLATSGDGVRTYPDNPCPGAGGGYVDHYDGVIRNNFVFANDSGLFASNSGFDCGICLWQACGAQVLHNTVASTQSPFSSIEWRFDYTDVDIINNLVSHNLRDRGGTSYLDGNLESQPLSLFVGGTNGDLHLAESASAAIDHGVSLGAGLCDDDYDGDARPIGSAPDVGADEYGTVTSLTLTLPSGGEYWMMGSQHQIHWTASGVITQVNLLYSSDGFANHTDDITTTLASSGSCNWTTPAITTSAMRVRIESVATSTISDTSDAFTLYDPATLTNTTYLPLTLTNHGSSSSGTLIQPGDMVYQGAFRLPDGDARPATFEYGGDTMTFNPNGDPGSADGFPGSLFVMGHDRMPYGELPNGNQVAEISIPEAVIADNLADLNQAGFVQGFHDVAQGFFGELEELPGVGMEYLDTPATGAKIHLVWGQNIQPDSAVASHAWFDPDLAAPDMQGTWFVGNQSLYSVNEYVFEIPSSWADEHAAGRYLGSGRFKDGGWGGMGPALLAYRPWIDGSGTPAPSGTQLEETVLLLYESSENTPDIERCLDGYQHPDEWKGGAWMTTASGKSALLFGGTKSTGAKYWYGFINPAGPEHPCVEDEYVGEFTVCRLADGTPCPPEDLTECAGHNGYRGWWSSHFDAQFIFYDPANLAQVAAGEMESWQPQPYASLNIDEYLFHNPAGVETGVLGTGVQRRYRIGAVAYDRGNGFLYVLELFADEARPVVHVWKVQ